VSEYGVHWNFYFTLAGVYLVYSSLRAFGKWASGPVVAILIAFGTLQALDKIQRSYSDSCVCRAIRFDSIPSIPHALRWRRVHSDCTPRQFDEPEQRRNPESDR
jgi:hypothetical protein